MSAAEQTDCIFCQIVQGNIPCFKVYEDDQTLAFMDINPVSEGHCLVIPKNHAENLMAMSPEDIAAVHQASQKVAAGLKKTLGAEGIAVLQLNGRAANQVVMHYHVHLIPRNTGDGLSVFEWEIKPGDMDRIGQVAKKLQAAV